jgi:predicted ATPase/class 3 adenylate cyclase
MKCPNCGTDVPEGQKFCTACGTQVSVSCPACGHTSSPAAKFCGECGATLAPTGDLAKPAMPPSAPTPPSTTASPAERRQLTVMFCDLVGSTALSARLDPEDLSQMIGACHRACAAEVSRFGGFIAQYLGDGVLAYFGYPQAHEDDAERAVRSALALTEAIGRLSSGFDFTPKVRIGIATGLVVVGDLTGEGAGREHAVMGETPNLAARLQALAEPNTVIIAPSTRQLTRGLFEYRDLGSVALKGFDAPVPVWQVVRTSSLQSRFEALHQAEMTPLVGREEELDLLLRCWRTVEAGEGQVVVLVGDPGIGKSRIVRALEERLGGEALTQLRYFCSPHHQDSAFFPIISQLERAAGFAREDLAEQKLAKLEVLLASVPMDPEAVAVIAALLSLPTDGRYRPPETSPQRRKEETLEVLLAQLDGLAAQHPVLMLFEDAHWIDPTSLEVLALTVERAPRFRVLVVITARPEFTSPWRGFAHVTMMPLTRLNQREGTTLVDRVTGGKALPSEVLEHILAHTDGVPLFIEELTKTVLESGLLREEDRRYALSGPLPPLAIPTTLHDSLLARLDRRAPVREVAQIGAAIGREFSYPLLSAVAGLAGDKLREALDELVRSELVFARGEPPQTVYTFKHALVRDAAYDALLRSRRGELHARIATVLEERFPEVVEQQPELLAQHCTHAGLTKPAIVYWSKAGRRSVARSALIEAVVQLRKGLDLLPNLPDGPDRWQRELEMQTTLAGALVASQGGGSREAGRAYVRARVLCEQLDDTSALVPVLAGQFTNHIGRCEYATARQIAEDLLRLGQSRNDAMANLVGNRSMGTCLHFAGEFAPAAEYFERVLNLYVPEQHSALATVAGLDIKVQGLVDSAWDLLILGYPDRALSRGEQGLIWSRKLNHPHSLALALVNGAIFDLLRRADQAALEALDEAIALATEQRFSHWRARAEIARGHVLVSRGETTEGLALARKAVADHAAIGSLPNHTYYLGLFAQSCERAGRADEALDLLDTALKMANNTGERWFEAELHRLIGESRLAHCSGEPVEAEAAFHRAMTVAHQQDARLWELRAAMSLSRLWREQGRQTAARDLLAPIYGWFTEGFDTPDLRDAKALLDGLK